MTPTERLIDHKSERHIGLVWISSLMILSLGALAFRMVTHIDWHNHGEWLRSAVFVAFTFVNSLRILAYVPQMLTAANDKNGASGISYATWTLFLISHLTTITYAIVCLNDPTMALIFIGNALACLAVLTITFCKRKQYAAQLADSLDKPYARPLLPTLR